MSRISQPYRLIQNIISYLHMHDTIQQGFLPQNLRLISCVTFLSSFSNGSWFFHIWHLLTRRHKTKTSYPRFHEKNLFSYDFVHNYLFRMLIPVPWLSLVLIYIWITASETNLQITYKREYFEKLLKNTAKEQKGIKSQEHKFKREVILKWKLLVWFLLWTRIWGRILLKLIFI